MIRELNLIFQRKVEENEERLQRLTANARKKKAATVDMSKINNQFEVLSNLFVCCLARQTKPLNTRMVTPSHLPPSQKIARKVVGLPEMRPLRAQAKTKSICKQNKLSLNLRSLFQNQLYLHCSKKLYSFTKANKYHPMCIYTCNANIYSHEVLQHLLSFFLLLIVSFFVLTKKYHTLCLLFILQCA